MMDEHGIWSKDQHVILYVFTNKFTGALRRIQIYDPIRLFPLFRGKTTLDNEWLTRESTEDEIKQVVN